MNYRTLKTIEAKVTALTEDLRALETAHLVCTSRGDADTAVEYEKAIHSIIAAIDGLTRRP